MEEEHHGENENLARESISLQRDAPEMNKEQQEQNMVIRELIKRKSSQPTCSNCSLSPSMK